MSHAQIWATAPVPVLAAEVFDPTPILESFHPPPGGTQFMFVTFPPDSVMQALEFDGAAARAENVRAVPGIGERFEPSGMHKTDTVDYGIVLEGEIWLELDDGQLEHLGKHDVVVQYGPRHAWRNRTDKPTLMAFVLIGACRDGDR